jgi:hypothetical protein
VPFKEHGLRLYLDKLILSRYQKYIGDKGLGRSFGGLKLLVRGLYEEGYLDEMTFKAYNEKYSKTLIEAARPVETSEPKTIADVREKQRIEELSRAFSGAVSQWENMKPKSRAYYIEKAKENPTIPNAKLILNYASGGT